jgi:Do/DeqQ family serine protease
MKIHRILAFLFTSIATGLAAAFIVVLLRPELIAPGVDSSPVQPVQPAVVTSTRNSFADAVSLASPSVVNIYASKIKQERVKTVFKDPVLQRFFGDRFDKTRLRRENSLGSGVVVDSNGYILTNQHVVKDASEIKVVINGDQVKKARVVGTDADTDLAVLQVGGEGLTVAQLGDSRNLRIGDIVLAIGNPFGIGKTVTQGIVSATGRHQLGLANYENFIQTDAAINQGNSGGALISADGKVVGINTAMLSGGGGSAGVGFAIPIEIAEEVKRQILLHGRVIRGWIGVQGQDVTQSLADSLGLDEVTGVLVFAVVTDGLAGIKPGDIIQGLDGKEIESSYQVLNQVAGFQPGREVSLDIMRNNELISLSIAVEERPADVN